MNRDPQPALDGPSAGQPDALAAVRAATRQAAQTILSPLGAIGAVATPLFLAVLYVNVAIMSAALETLFRTQVVPVFSLWVFTTEREITYFDIIGLLVSVLQMASAVILLDIVQTQRSSREAYSDAISKLLRLMSAGALVLFVAFEAVASAHRAGLAGGTAVAVATASLTALGLALAVAVLGAVCMHFFWLPLLRLLTGGGLLAVGALARYRRRAV